MNATDAPRVNPTPRATGSLVGRDLLAGIEPDPGGDAGHTDHPPRMGFFTDTSVCVGCKACEVACKQWNALPQDGLELTGMSYDNTQGLGASSWRHVAFVEQERPLPVDQPSDSQRTELRLLMASDVCKHCTHAACLDVCPTGALFRTELGTVVVQQDVCNGCGYCVPACPYGVIEQRPDDGRAFKCTMCYDRLGAGMEPACAKACPTESIQFGPLDELRERAASRVEKLHRDGVADARLYGEDPDDGVGGADPARRPGRRVRRPRYAPPRRTTEFTMNGSDVTRDGIRGERPGREAHGGQGTVRAGRRGARRGEELMVPKAEFSSYYGRPILNAPSWEPLDIAGYFFLGGLAGAGSVLAVGAALTGRPVMERAMKVSSLLAARCSLLAARCSRSADRPSRSCTTWVGRSASPTCCASSSRPRR